MAIYGGKSMSPCQESCDNLPRIHDVVRVERSLDGDHHVQRCPSMLGSQVFHLALPHPVLPSAGPIHRQRPLNQAFRQCFGAL